MMLMQVSVVASMVVCSSAFLGSHVQHRNLPFVSSSSTSSLNLFGRQKEENWIDRIVPLDMENKEEAMRRVAEVEEYNIGISGVSFQTGMLSGQMYEAMMSRQDQDMMSEEIKRSYKIYAMDFTAKEATRTALKQNGFESPIEEEDMDEWGIVDSIQLLDPEGQPVGSLHDNWNRAVDKWTPGQGFNFVAREVPAKLKELALQDVMESLDPDGSLRSQAEEKGITVPTEELQSLTDLANEVKRRTEEAPRGSSTAEEAFKGDSSRGYSAVSRADLLTTNKNLDGSENQKTLMHVMNALVSHGCLIVDLADQKGADDDISLTMSKMWGSTDKFFKTLDSNPETEKQLPRMSAIPASPFAKMGYANFQDGMKFMETRVERGDGGAVMPVELSSIVGQDGMDSLKRAFGVIASVGKDVVRIATAASTLENSGFIVPSEETPAISGVPFLAEEDEDDSAAAIKSSDCATLMVEELLDDGTLLQGNDQQGAVSMSPHRLCSYSNIKEDTPAEVFGAHTDSSFVTIVPVASVAGLEVYDEDAEKWYRPELKARSIWESEREENGEDPEALFETIKGGDGEDDILIPWHARYLVVVPGEFLQIASRNEIVAAVHRVVASGPARLSAPVLVRGRPGVTVDVPRYLGEINDKLLEQVNGLNMQQIHDALQPGASK